MESVAGAIKIENTEAGQTFGVNFASDFVACQQQIFARIVAALRRSEPTAIVKSFTEDTKAFVQLNFSGNSTSFTVIVNVLFGGKFNWRIKRTTYYLFMFGYGTLALVLRHGQG